MRTTELFWRGLRDEAREHGWMSAIALLIARLAGVVRDSFPDRRRMRFGDIQFDIDHRVNTTWANVPFKTRLREALINAEYQTTDPQIFAEAMAMLRTSSEFHVPSSENPVAIFERFTFIDLGSGKGRVLLMAAEYGFRMIVGVELLPELHEIARGNTRPEPRIELVLADVRTFEFPNEPLVVFLFNPFPAHVVREVMRRLQRSLLASPRTVFVIFHNAVYESELTAAPDLRKLGATHQFVIYAAQ